MKWNRLQSDEIQDINQLRNRLINSSIILLSIIVIPALVFTLLEVKLEGWSFQKFAYIAATVILYVLLIFRQRLSLRLKSWTLIGTLLFLAMLILSISGFYGAGVIFLMTAVLFSSLMIGPRSGGYILAIGVVSLSIIGYLIVNKVLTITFDFELINSSYVEWISDIILFLMLCGAIVFSIGTIFKALSLNIAILKKRNAELEFARDEAEVANRAKSAFLTNVSHEVRTPLNSINGHADMLASDIKDPGQRSHLESIKQNSGILLDLINRILTLSEFETGKIQVHPTEVNLYECMKHVSEEIRIRAEFKGIDFSIHCSESCPKSILVDRIHLNVIISNLLENAVKFTDKGYVRFQCMATPVSGSKDKTDLIFSVEDSGIGMSEEFLRYRHQAFTQEDDRLSRQHEGIGIGLTLAKKLTEVLGGRIEIESELNKGTRITVKLQGVQADFSKEYSKTDPIDLSRPKQKGKPIVISPEKGKAIRIALEKLETGLFKQWETFEDHPSMKDVKKFADQILQMGNSLELQFIVDYGQSLADACEGFDIEQVLVLVKQYEALIEKCKGLLKGN